MFTRGMVVIRKPNELNVNSRYRVLLYGNPGLRKSTTGLSAPAPLIVDTDKGWERIDVRFRRADYIQPETYKEILDDLSGDLSAYETIVFDTGGTMFTMMKEYLVQTDPKNGKRDGSLSLQGYGSAAREFDRLMNHCYYALNKNVVIIFHAKEKSEGDQSVFRLDIEGQTSTNVWKNMDLGGFMEMQGNKFTCTFSPSERFFAKGTRGISGSFEVPSITNGDQNNFLSDLFNRFRVTAKEELHLVEEYDVLMGSVREKIAQIEDAETANKILKEIAGFSHVFASKQESWVLLKEKAEKLGFSYFDGSFQVKK
jgi:hypothetical protein